MAILKSLGLHKSYQNEQNTVEALKDCNIEINAGECVAISGTKASGKTTLLRLLGGLERPTNGKVYVNHKDITAYSDDELALMRRNEIGFLFQNAGLIPELTVQENIMIPLMLAHKKLDGVFYREMLERLNLTNVLNRYPKHLSEKQIQNTVYARALINQPSIILADEAVSRQMEKDTLDFLMNMVFLYHKTLIMVTNDNELNLFVDHIIRLKHGVVVEDRRI